MFIKIAKGRFVNGNLVQEIKLDQHTCTATFKLNDGNTITETKATIEEFDNYANELHCMMNSAKEGLEAVDCSIIAIKDTIQDDLQGMLFDIYSELKQLVKK